MTDKAPIQMNREELLVYVTSLYREIEQLEERVRMRPDVLRNAELAIAHWSRDCEAEVTCLKCARNRVCEFAWDPYNTEGDCLDEK
jgi:hypothetical protein